MPTHTSSKKSEKSLKARSVNVSTRAKLSPIGDLVTQTWNLLKTKFGTYALLFLIQCLAFVVLVLITVGVGIAGGVGAGLSGINWQAMTESGNWWPIIATAGTFLGVLILVAVVVGMLMSLVFSAAMIAVAAAGNTKLSVGEALRVGRSKMGALFLVSLIGGALILGGFFLFVIPGIIFAILFSFATYAVVLDDLKPMAALRTSASLVKNHFWEILGRIAVLVLINIGVTLVLGAIMGSFGDSDGNAGLAFVGSILNIVVNIGMMAFSVIYVTLLYKQLRTAKVAAMSLQWIGISAVVGLVLMVLMVGGIINAARYAAKNLPANWEDKMMQDWETGSETMEADIESGDQMTEDDWERLFQSAIQDATQSGTTNDTDSMMRYEY